ncbi:hypothetical protein CYY_000568 [Polysphondylium violaceum]|uniref:TAFII55 protein conserved region domain-containing protein n=1 Tax=Polysphondylium violaceum TaxID=133409 RepID=A0A8J4Q3J1_9MYCE|nr:hypothetical protein CYY_000568 [Polysphondylium violaceum]
MQQSNSNTSLSTSYGGGGGGGTIGGSGLVSINSSSSGLNSNNINNNANNTDINSGGYGRPDDSEDQLLLRLPPHLSDKLKRMLRQKHIDVPIDFQFKTDRQIQFKFDDQEFNASLCDLPCIIESHKTFDKLSFYKTADIGQMIIVHDNNNNNMDQSNNNVNNNSGISEQQLQLQQQNYKLNSGITPPTKDIVKKRYKNYNREKVTELAKLEEALVRTIKPAYSEQEDIEFVSLADLKDKYGTDLFSQNSREPVIFEEKAEEQFALDDDMDSGEEDEVDESDIEHQIRTIKIKTPSYMMKPPHQQSLNNNNSNNNSNRHDSDDDSRHHRRSHERSPLDSHKSPSSAEKRERKQRSDKGRERGHHHPNSSSSHSNNNNNNNPTVTTPTIGSTSLSNPLKIKLSYNSIPTSPEFKPPEERSILSPQPTSISARSPLSPGSGDERRRSKKSSSSSSSISPQSPRGGEERKRKRDRDHSPHRSSRNSSGNNNNSNNNIITPSKSMEDIQPNLNISINPASPQLTNLGSSTPTTTTTTSINSPPTNSNVSSPPLQSISTPPSIPVNTTTTTTTNQQPVDNTSPSLRHAQTIPIISPIINSMEAIPTTPTTPATPMSIAEQPTPPIPSQSSKSNNDSELFNLVSNLRRLQQESQSNKSKLEKAQHSYNSAPNKMIKDRSKAKVDELIKIQEAKEQEIELLESQIMELKSSNN